MLRFHCAPPCPTSAAHYSSFLSFPQRAQQEVCTLGVGGGIPSRFHLPVLGLSPVSFSQACQPQPMCVPSFSQHHVPGYSSRLLSVFIPVYNQMTFGIFTKGNKRMFQKNGVRRNWAVQMPTWASVFPQFSVITVVQFTLQDAWVGKGDGVKEQ